MAKQPDSVVLSGATIHVGPFGEGDLHAATALHVHTTKIPPELLTQLREWCRPKVLYLRLPFWPANRNVLLAMMDQCGVHVEEFHVEEICHEVQDVLHRLPNLRHLHLCPEATSAHVYSVLSIRSPRFTDISLHGYMRMETFLQLSEHPTVRTIHYPDLPWDLHCGTRLGGWASFLAEFVHIMPKLEPRLKALANDYKQARLEAVAAVLPVVGVPEIIMDMLTY
jgi:hypothetical protein